MTTFWYYYSTSQRHIDKYDVQLDALRVILAMTFLNEIHNANKLPQKTLNNSYKNAKNTT